MPTFSTTPVTGPASSTNRAQSSAEATSPTATTRGAALGPNEVRGDLGRARVHVGAHHVRALPGREHRDRAAVADGRVGHRARSGARADHEDAPVGKASGHRRHATGRPVNS